MEGKSLSRNGRILEESCSRVDDEWPQQIYSVDIYSLIHGFIIFEEEEEKSESGRDLSGQVHVLTHVQRSGNDRRCDKQSRTSWMSRESNTEAKPLSPRLSFWSDRNKYLLFLRLVENYSSILQFTLRVVRFFRSVGRSIDRWIDRPIDRSITGSITKKKLDI